MNQKRKANTAALAAAIVAVVLLNVAIAVWQGSADRQARQEEPITAPATVAATTVPATVTAGRSAATDVGPTTAGREATTPATSAAETDDGPSDSWVPDASKAVASCDVSGFRLPTALPAGVTRQDFASVVSRWLAANGCARLTGGRVVSLWADGDGTVMTWTCEGTDAASGLRATFVVNWTTGNPLTITLQ